MDIRGRTSVAFKRRFLEIGQNPSRFSACRAFYCIFWNYVGHSGSQWRRVILFVGQHAGGFSILSLRVISVTVYRLGGRNWVSRYILKSPSCVINGAEVHNCRLMTSRNFSRESLPPHSFFSCFRAFPSARLGVSSIRKRCHYCTRVGGYTILLAHNYFNVFECRFFVKIFL